MELAEHSIIFRLVFRLVFFLLDAWDSSGTARLARRVGGRIKGVFSNSVVAGYVMRTGRSIAASWPYSLVCRGLARLLNAVPVGLSAVYRKKTRLFDESIATRGISYLGDNAPVLMSWVILALMVIPHELWNNLYSFFGLIAILLLCYVGGMKKESIRIDVKSVGMYPVLFFAMVFLSFIFSTNISLSYRYICFHIASALTVLVCVSTVKSTEDLLRLVGFAIVGIGLASLYGLLQRFMGIEVNELLVDVNVNADTPGRVYSFFENPNAFAKVLVMFVPMALSMFIYSEKKWISFISLGIFLVGAIALLLTYSRGGWIGIAAGLVVYMLLLKPAIIPIAILIIGVAIPVLPDSIYNRILSIFNTKDTSSASRIPLFKATYELIKDNPMTGVGLGNDVLKEAIYDGEYYSNQMNFIHAHNIYLQIWAETGFFGLLTFLGSIISAFSRGVKVIRAEGSPKILRGVIAAGISGLTGVLVFGVVDYIWAYPRVMTIFWLLFAITVTAIKLAGQNLTRKV